MDGGSRDFAGDIGNSDILFGADEIGALAEEMHRRDAHAER